MRNTIRGISLGFMGMDMETMVFPHPKYALSTGRQAGAKVWYRCPALGYIIDTHAGRILWDTGPSPSWPTEWPADMQQMLDLSEVTPEVGLEQRLKELGLGPEDFAFVVQGHLHADHAGGLRLFESAGAQILVHEDEYRHAQQIEETGQAYVRKDWNFLQHRRATLVYGDQDLSKDVRLLSLPGHTPGTMGMLVRLDRTGWVLLTDDAMFIHESYGPPAVGSIVSWNQDRWSTSLERIRSLAKEHNAFLFPGHDMTGIKHSNPEHIEFKKIEFHPFSPGYVYE